VEKPAAGKKYRAAVIGEREIIYGFACAGLEIVPVDDPADAGRQLRTLAENDCAVIFVTESIYPHLRKEAEAYRESTLPAVILIPGTEGSTGRGAQRVRESVIRAVGSDILFQGGNNS